ncbi:MAG: chloride channel protein [Schaalia hyovaginalis]|uniref:chloride channel protein n=1 Tax=Schaalia hyovaginalis TaxID=29316 RepID=UPI0023F981EC|nr:chloride channel protein [Schaalia hyovaginalis]MCI7672546.1 chloride channel protein [Schaalia hyovaginalis]MDY5506108.1 chloride channel protein [Schaalia hyovaginalis]
MSAADSRRRIGARIGGHRSLIGLVAAAIGVLVGLASVLFTLMIEGWTWVSTGYEEYSTRGGAPHGVLAIPSWALLLAAPLVAAAVYGPLVHRFAPSARGHGIPEVMLAVRRKEGAIPGRVAVVKLIASSLTIGSGGSAGREGPIVQVGAALGSSMARFLGLDARRVVLLAACGAAGGIAATFHAPLAGAVFALEVILTRFTAETFGYVVISSVAASIIARALQGDSSVVRVAADLEAWTLTDMWWVALLGVLAGLVGLGFSKLLYLIEDGLDAVWSKIPAPEWARPIVFAPLLGLGLICFPQMYGSGTPIEEAALDGRYALGFLILAMLGRALYTSFTIGMGGSGGVFAPTLFIGAMAGTAFGTLIDPLTASAPGVFGVIAMGAAFAGAARAPMTAVLIIVEMTGTYSLILPMMLAVVLATGVSRFLTRGTIYTEKLRRRGDVLADPVEATLVGSKPVKQWMEGLPALLTPTTTPAGAAALMRTSGSAELPLVDAEGRFTGLVSALDLLSAHPSQGRALAELVSLKVSVNAEDSPHLVLSRLLTSGTSGVPVLDAEGRPVGWVSERSLVARLEEEQKRALAARAESSWGSRWKQRHAR